jgi:hypothetical protein
MTNDTKQFLRGWRSGVLGSVIGVSAVIALAACDGVERSDSEAARFVTTTTEDRTEGLAVTSTEVPTATTTIDWWTPEDQAASQERVASGAPTDLGIPDAEPAQPVPQPDYVGGEGWFVNGEYIVQPEMCADAEDNCLARFKNGRWEAYPYDD